MNTQFKTYENNNSITTIVQPIVTNLAIENYSTPNEDNMHNYLATVNITKTFDIHAPRHFETIKLGQMIEEIRSGKYSREIVRLRSSIKAKANGDLTIDKDRIASIKKSLPAYSVSGTFTDSVINSNFQDFSGIISIDWDHLGANNSLKAELANHASCVFAVTSPSGDGVKVGFTVNARVSNDAEYKVAFAKLVTILKATYPSVANYIDENCRDIRRFMFTTFDSVPYVNYEALPLELGLDIIKTPLPVLTILQTPLKSTSNVHPAKIRSALKHINSWERKTWLSVACAIKFELGDEGFDLFHNWSALDPITTRYGGVEDCLKTWNTLSRSDGDIVTIGTLFHLAKEGDWDNSIDQQSALDTIEDTDNYEAVLMQTVNIVLAGFHIERLDGLVEHIKNRNKLGLIKTKLIKAVKNAVMCAPRETLSDDIALDGMDFDFNKQRYLPSTTNLLIALRNPERFGVHIGFDSFTQQQMHHNGNFVWTRFQDTDYTRFIEQLMLLKFGEINSNRFRDTVRLVARENTFDSAKDWLEPLEWDNKSRVDSFFADYLGAETSDYATAVSQYMWSALAGRILQPGVQADMVPILIGKQGGRKSSSIRTIAPCIDFYCEVDLGDNDADTARKMQGKVVVELSELRGLGYDKDQEGIKAFITRTVDEWIPKYVEESVRVPRRSIFIGTTNETEILHDSTGNRRFLPIKIKNANTDKIEADRLQLWAEAKALFNENGIIWKAAESLGQLVHDDHESEDPWHNRIRIWVEEGKQIPPGIVVEYKSVGIPALDMLTRYDAEQAYLKDMPLGREGFTTNDLFSNTILDINIQNRTLHHTRRVSKILKKLNLEQRRVQTDGDRSKRWYKIK